MQHGERRRPPLGDVQDVHEGACEQPRHERGVLDGVPAPVAAPAEYLIGPVAADEDARTEEPPGQKRPLAGRLQPARLRPILEQRSHRVGERHGEQGVADEDDGRMHRHPGILQQRIEADAVLHGRHRCDERALGQHENDEQRLNERVDQEPRRLHVLPAAEVERCQRVDEQP